MWRKISGDAIASWRGVRESRGKGDVCRDSRENKILSGTKEICVCVLRDAGVRGCYGAN